jgi:hypothetical protein
MIVVAVAVVMWESPQGFPRGMGRVESRLYGFPCFPYPGISMACFRRHQPFPQVGIAIWTDAKIENEVIPTLETPHCTILAAKRLSRNG